jgi:hypothetical protein
MLNVALCRPSLPTLMSEHCAASFALAGSKRMTRARMLKSGALTLLLIATTGAKWFGLSRPQVVAFWILGLDSP